MSWAGKILVKKSKSDIVVYKKNRQDWKQKDLAVQHLLQYLGEGGCGWEPQCVVSLQYVWDRMLGGFKHKNNRTREGVCLCLIATLNTWVIAFLSNSVDPWRRPQHKPVGFPAPSFFCPPGTELKAWPSVRLSLTFVTCWETQPVRYMPPVAPGSWSSFWSSSNRK